MPQPTSGKKKSGLTSTTPAPDIAAPEQSKSRTERRQELFDQRRAERRKAPAKKQREKLLTRVILGGIAAILLIGVSYEVITYIMDRDERQRPENVVTYAYAGGDHTSDTVDYPESPPVGGTHDPVWQTCDFYDGVIRNENAVHSLEHGAVWITYRPDIAETELDELRDIWGNDRFVLVSEYDDQASPIVATAWNNQLEIANAGDIELKQFINYYRQGPQTQEPGATCSGGSTAVLG